MSLEHSHLHITNDHLVKDLIPALRDWEQELEEVSIKPLLWFVFGSVVKATASDENIDPIKLFARELLGVRGQTNPFCSESDIDIGLVVPDGQDLIDLKTYNKESPFRTAAVTGHPLQLTRFAESWFTKRKQTTDSSKWVDSTLGIFGTIFPIEVEGKA